MILGSKSDVVSICNKAAKSFWNEGHISIPSFLSEESCRLLEAEINRLSRSTIAKQYGRIDKNGNLTALTSLDRVSSTFFDFVRDNDFIEAAGALFESRVVPMNVEYFVKVTGSDVATPPHQDHAYFRNGGLGRAASFWVALDVVTDHSGALEYATVTPEKLLPHKRSLVAEFELELVDASPFIFRAVAVPRGGCTVHHSFVMHRSVLGVNRSTRRAVSFSFRGVSA